MADCACYWLKGMRDKTVPAASSAAASREAAQRDWTEGKILNNLLSLSGRGRGICHLFQNRQMEKEEIVT